MPQLRADLVVELVAPDAAAAPAGTGGVARLHHEAGDDAVEDDIVVVPPLAERGEVLARPRRVPAIQLERDGALYNNIQHVFFFDPLIEKEIQLS